MNLSRESIVQNRPLKSGFRNAIEPFQGRILDPACGSGGMFVQSARFVAEHKRSGGSEEGTRGAATEISIYGQLTAPLAGGGVVPSR